ncbi:hypothetical protein HKX42_07040 [Salinisphaera sp. USBA-960]|uniref:lysylphosphatidylglycerol synthase domain-containing protein n=1 Tax=Salinisphaera orenii TaxID=856731 RepID=UPI000DBE12BD|nr:hypothetical protein [Salifodinibacter halophilus]NNC26627.1 hypothetical protein [Salifodinibacter halophilus]
MNYLGALLALAGLGLTGYLIANIGADQIGAAISLVGTGFIWLVLARLLAVGLDAAGWHVLVTPFDRARRAGLTVVMWIALVREGVARLLPVASLGGDIVGIRLLNLRGVPASGSIASVVVEIVVTLIAQFMFTGLGLALFLLWLHPGPTVNKFALALLAASPIPLVLVFILRRFRVFERGQRLASRLLGGDTRLAQLLPDGAQLDTDIRRLIDNAGRLASSIVLQLAGMIAGGLEIWLITWLLGDPIGPLAAVALESIVLAARHLAFFIPAGLGIQETGFVIFGQMLGLEPDSALAISLIRRIREVITGAPMLVTWQIAELRAARRQKQQD